MTSRIAIALTEALALRARNGGPGSITGRILAQGEGWTVEDVICTSGPQDRPFEERHAAVSIAIVAAGMFQYRSAGGRELMTPGSLLLGGAAQCYECGHEHGAGDRCVSFAYAPGYFEAIAADAGAAAGMPGFHASRLPPMRALAPLVAPACAAVAASGQEAPWEEISVRLAARVVQVLGGLSLDSRRRTLPHALARVTRAIRAIDREPGAPHTLRNLAREACLSPYHFLRVFEQLTGVTPHQYVLRSRLREAAIRLAAERAKVIDVALDCGFGDVSNFNRAFRAEFGTSPRGYRLRAHAGIA